MVVAVGCLWGGVPPFPPPERPSALLSHGGGWVREERFRGQGLGLHNQRQTCMPSSTGLCVWRNETGAGSVRNWAAGSWQYAWIGVAFQLGEGHVVSCSCIFCPPLAACPIRATTCAGPHSCGCCATTLPATTQVHSGWAGLCNRKVAKKDTTAAVLICRSVRSLHRPVCGMLLASVSSLHVMASAPSCCPCGTLTR
jgi:hypothetical protein